MATAANSSAASTSIDEKSNLIRKLRSENFEQFQEFVNMQLTRTDLELSMDDLEALWHMKPGQSLKKVGGGGSSGDFLEKLVNRLRRRPRTIQRQGAIYRRAKAKSADIFDTHRLLMALKQMIDYLGREENLKVEGIFRRSGSHLRRSNLVSLLKTVDSFCFEDAVIATDATVLDVADTFKAFLKELPQPLFSDAHYSIYAEIADWAQNSNLWPEAQRRSVVRHQMRVVRLLLLILPKVVFELLQQVLRLLHDVASYQDENKMNASNLAKIFVPVLLLPRSLPEEQLCDRLPPMCSLLTSILERVDDVFKPPKELVQDVAVYYALRSGLAETTSSSSLEKELNNGAAISTTVFVNMQRSIADDKSISAETEVAKLYADVQQMPDGREKSRLLKQFQEWNHQQLLRPADRRKSLKRKADMDQNVMNQLARMPRISARESFDEVHAAKKRRSSLTIASTGSNSCDSDNDKQSSPLVFANVDELPPPKGALSRDRLARVLDLNEIERSGSYVTPAMLSNAQRNPKLDGPAVFYPGAERRPKISAHPTTYQF